MDIKGMKGVLSDGASKLGVELTDEGLEAFVMYLAELRVWNKRINLTSVDSEMDIIVRHFLDSLTICRFFSGNERIIDLGAGAGFPGIPLKLAFPSIDLVLVDSVDKKVHFMRHIIRTLGIKSGIEAISARADDRSVIEKYGSSFDAVVSRAFTSLSGFIGMGLPFLKKGGRVIAMKGPSVDEEMKEASSIKGIGEISIVKIKVPFDSRSNWIAVCERL